MAVGDSAETVTETIIGFINQILDRPVSKQEISPQTRLADDLGMRSIGLITLVVCCEREFKIALMASIDVRRHLATLGDLRDFIQQALKTSRKTNAAAAR